MGGMVEGAQPWQQVTVPTVKQAAANFPQPPAEYGAIHWAIWGAGQTPQRVMADIDRIHAAGGTVYMINNSRGVTPQYLSPEYMDVVKAVVAQCKKNGMKVWIETDCGYPDGFAGGAISKDYPQLGMKGIAIDARCTVSAGETLDIPLPVDTLGIIARPVSAPIAAVDGDAVKLPAEGMFKYATQRGQTATLAVQVGNAVVRYTVSPGEPFAIPVAGVKGITVAAGGGGAGGRAGRGGGAAGPAAATIVAVPADGKLKWTAPAGGGAYELSFVRHIFKTSPTRNDNGDDGGATKDTFYSLIDFLDPEAVATFTKLIHETYAKAVGDEFGKTVLGFRGDETDFTNVTPWTPRLLETFKAQKGYDLQPHIASWFVTPLSDEAKRVKADYYDVWSGMFRDTFYKQQQEWCRARGMDYMVHLNHEEVMVGRNGGESMTTNEGSFFRDMRYVGVPGVDNLNQIAPGIVADFPKLAGSAAHLFGRAQVWSEEGGALGSTGKFVFDYQLVRGINYMNVRGMTGQAAGGGGGARGRAGAATAAASAPANDMRLGTGFYYTRAQYLMAIGRPAAQVALYMPEECYWLNDAEADASTVKLTTALMEHQIDFDHIDADTLVDICKLENGGLKNESGQVYRAVIVPSASAIQKKSLDRLKAFAAAGGKVIFVGRVPQMVADRTFLNAETRAPDVSWATVEPVGELTAKVIAALPDPDVKLEAACPPIKYTHRSLSDGEIYLFFNESAEEQKQNVTLRGSGDWQEWDAATGKITGHPVIVKARGEVRETLTLAPHEAKLVVLGPMP
jgi:hypothetical protein